MTTAADLYMKCQRCDAVWKIGALPAMLPDLEKRVQRARCPTCGEKDDLSLMPTHGRGAARGPRPGKETR